MLLPNKYIPIEDTLPNMGRIVYERLSFPLSLERLWGKVKKQKDIGTYDRFIYTLDFLYAVDLIKLENGLIKRT